MSTFNRVAGDVDTIVAYLYGVSTFTGATVEAHVWNQTTAKVPLTAAVVNGTDPQGRACGVCTVQLGTWLSGALTGGTWFLEYDVTFVDTTRITWPGEHPDQIIVRSQA